MLVNKPIIKILNRFSSWERGAEKEERGGRASGLSSGSPGGYCDPGMLRPPAPVKRRKAAVTFVQLLASRFFTI